MEKKPLGNCDRENMQQNIIENAKYLSILVYVSLKKYLISFKVR